MTRPRTFGTTALIALTAIRASAGVAVAAGCVLCWLVLNTPVESLPAAVGALATITGATQLAIGGLGGAGSYTHGRRHFGGPPAPTSAELAALPQPPEV